MEARDTLQLNKLLTENNNLRNDVLNLNAKIRRMKDEHEAALQTASLQLIEYKGIIDSLGKVFNTYTTSSSREIIKINDAILKNRDN